MLLVVQVTEEATVEPGAIHEPLHVPIPLLHSGWQFACRTAGLPRAPSFLA
jgi:hypothetical protein